MPLSRAAHDECSSRIRLNNIKNNRKQEQISYSWDQQIIIWEESAGEKVQKNCKWDKNKGHFQHFLSPVANMADYIFELFLTFS